MRVRSSGVSGPYAPCRLHANMTRAIQTRFGWRIEGITSKVWPPNMTWLSYRSLSGRSWKAGNGISIISQKAMPDRNIERSHLGGSRSGARSYGGPDVPMSTRGSRSSVSRRACGRRHPVVQAKKAPPKRGLNVAPFELVSRRRSDGCTSGAQAAVVHSRSSLQAVRTGPAAPGSGHEVPAQSRAAQTVRGR
jgi:hypothetical protein